MTTHDRTNTQRAQMLCGIIIIVGVRISNQTYSFDDTYGLRQLLDPRIYRDLIDILREHTA